MRRGLIGVLLALCGTAGAAAQSPPKPAPADWNERSRAPGVFRAWKLETEENTGLNQRKPYSPFGIYTRPDGGHDMALDPVDPPPGSKASLRFTFHSHSGANNGGWYGNFNDWKREDAGKIQYPSTHIFGKPGDEFWVQFLYKVNDAKLDEDIRQPTGERIGHKISDLVGGDRSFSVPFYTSESGKLVLTTVSSRRPEWPMLYTYWPWDGYTDNLFGYKLDTARGAKTYDFQPRDGEAEIGISYLDYSSNGGRPDWTPKGGRGRILPNRWMAWQHHLQILDIDKSARGDPTGALHRKVRVRLYHANLGDKEWALVLDHTRSLLLPFKGKADPRDGWGQLVLFPYLTNKDPKQAHKPMHVWYAQAIASRKEIPLPAAK
jgi:hypothetical protein